jgi:hypothetical protein
MYSIAQNRFQKNAFPIRKPEKYVDDWQVKNSSNEDIRNNITENETT